MTIDVKQLETNHARSVLSIHRTRIITTQVKTHGYMKLPKEPKYCDPISMLKMPESEFKEVYHNEQFYMMCDKAMFQRIQDRAKELELI